MAQLNRRLSNTGDSLYAMLEVPKTATLEEIKRSYRKLALSNHPDKNPGDEVKAERFKEISKTYAILSDETKRTIYDQYGSRGLYISEQLGAENVKAYFMITSPWARAAFFVVALITGCFCCCCCCCCCNCCCGKCRPEVDEDSTDYSNLQEEGADGDPGASPSTSKPVTITSQPAAPAPATSTNESSPLKGPPPPAYN